MNIKDNSRNQPTDLAEHAIINRAHKLTSEIEPETDLWPAIVDAIRELPQEDVNHGTQNSWMPMALAASILIAVGSLGFIGYTNYSVQQSVAPLADNQSTIDLIEQPYQTAKASYMTAIAVNDNAMSPEVRAVLKKNLKIIDQASEEIRLALKSNPNDPFLTDALLMTRQKEIQLLNQVSAQRPDTI